MSKVVGFGDLLLRLCAPGYQRFLQAVSYDANYTGAEANVLASLALNGIPTQFVTKLPDNPIGDAALSSLRKYAIGLEHVSRGGRRLGLYYLERGASQRPSRCVYDREYSSFALSVPEDYDWDAIFDGATHFHFTGITPALGGKLPEICMAACRAAKARGITVSLDLNYRSMLWSVEQARKVMVPLMDYVDILIGGREDAAKMLGVNSDLPEENDACTEIARVLSERYALQAAAFTLRKSMTASENKWRAMLYTGGQSYFSREYSIHLVDRVGGGDSFSAGLLYGLINGFAPQHLLEFAVAASCLKQTIEQDFNLALADEVEQLVNGDGTARILR